MPPHHDRRFPQAGTSRMSLHPIAPQLPGDGLSLRILAPDPLIALVEHAVARRVSEYPYRGVIREGVDEPARIAAHADIGVDPEAVPVLGKVEMGMQLRMSRGSPEIRMIVDQRPHIPALRVERLIAEKHEIAIVGHELRGTHNVVTTGDRRIDDASSCRPLPSRWHRNDGKRRRHHRRNRLPKPVAPCLMLDMVKERIGGPMESGRSLPVGGGVEAQGRTEPLHPSRQAIMQRRIPRGAAARTGLDLLKIKVPLDRRIDRAHPAMQHESRKCPVAG